MITSPARTKLQELLSRAGIRINGSRPWDLKVHDERFFGTTLAGGTLAIGNAYVDGWWDSDKLDELVARIFAADLYARFASGPLARLRNVWARLTNPQDLRRSRQVADAHYNLGNDLFAAMLDGRMNYTCAFWEGAANLDEAQEAKLDLICRKLELRPGLTVLDLGCGWGAFARFAAERYGVSVCAYNIAEEQLRLARDRSRGFPIHYHLADYRRAVGTFDRVVSIGIMEHVGPSNHRAYMQVARRCLKDDGIAFIHSIVQNESRWTTDPWFDRHIFPNGVTPSLAQLAKAMEGLFVVEDCHNIGPHYDPTLLAWHDNLTAAWPSLRARYGERLYRMMKYYLLSSAGCFRARRSQVLHIVATTPGRHQPSVRLLGIPRRRPAEPAAARP